MSSIVDICRMALTHIGENNDIDSVFPPDDTPQARNCQIYYPIARDALLELYAWSFATRTEKLPRYAGELEGRFTLAYPLPSDYLRVIAIENNPVENGMLEYEIGIIPDINKRAVMIRDQYENDAHRKKSEVETTFIFRQQDSNQFSPTFTSALSWQLASYLVASLERGNEGISASAKFREMAAGEVRFAINLDYQQRNIKIDHIPEWLQERR